MTSEHDSRLRSSLPRKIGVGGLLLLAMIGLSGCVVYPAGGYYAPGYAYAPGVYVGGGYGYYGYHGGWRGGWRR
mgnify:CR=1 FL=1